MKMMMGSQKQLLIAVALLLRLQETTAFQGKVQTTILLQKPAFSSRVNPLTIAPKHQPRHQYLSSSSPLWASKDENDKNGQLRKRDILRNVLAKFAIRSKFEALTKKIAVSKKKWLGFFLAAAVLVGVLTNGSGTTAGTGASPAAPVSTKTPIEIPYSQFMDYCEGATRGPKSILNKLMLNNPDRIANVQIDAGKITFQLKQGASYSTHVIEGTTTESLVQYLRQHKVPFQAGSSTVKAASSGAWTAGEVAMAGGIGFYMYRNKVLKGGDSSASASSAKGSLMGGKKKNKKGQNNAPSTSFDDIEGIGEAKEAVLELVDTLRNPEKYSLVGARAPTGLLLEGPPGTGKTTLARAAASLADVPFLSASGSEFVDKYVGQGAARVRQLFERAEKIAAKEKRPCIIFIDEIDALGKARSGSSDNNASQEGEHTLIQLLASMDGLDTSRSSDAGKMICVLGATNRKDVLDPALVRPGRFDRIIKVDLPNTTGRESILRVHAQKLLGFSEGSGVDPSRENR